MADVQTLSWTTVYAMIIFYFLFPFPNTLSHVYYKSSCVSQYSNEFLHRFKTVTRIFMLWTINESYLFLVWPTCRTFASTFARSMLVVQNEFHADHVEPAIRIAIELQLDRGSIDIP